MRHAAEMEVRNKFTTAEIKMEVQNSNMISNNMIFMMLLIIHRIFKRKNANDS